MSRFPFIHLRVCPGRSAHRLRCRPFSLLGAVGASLIVFVAGCGDDPIEEAANIAESCGGFDCPTGTAPRDSASLTASLDISAGVDVSSYSGEAAFARFGQGECEYFCETINPCPCPSDAACTFPIITDDCFTCATLNASGELEQPECNR